MNKTNIKGIIYMLIGTAALASMGVFIKLIGTGLPTSTTLFARFITSTIVIIPIVLRDKNFSLKVNRPGIIVARCAAGLLGMTLYFFAIKYMVLVNAVLLQNTRPIWVPIILFIFLGSKTNWKVVLSIIICFIGITIIIRPVNGIFNPISFLPLVSGLLAAVAMILLRIFIKDNKYKTNEALFYYFTFCAVITFIAMMLNWKTPTSYQFMLLVFVGIFGTVYQFFMTSALKYISVSVAAPLVYITVIFAGFYDWILWNIPPDLLTITGALILVLGATCVVYFNNKGKTKETISLPKHS